MGIRHDIRLTIGLFLASNLVMAFGSISLLERMTPAIRRILQENVYSLDAVEDMLTVLASSGAPPNLETRAKFESALVRASENITEPAETALIAGIRQRNDAALRGDPASRGRVIEDLRRLGEVNRQAMRRADDEAIRLGTAGSWVIVLLGVIGFLMSLMMLIRLNRHVVRPVEEIYEALREWKEGNTRRRCIPSVAPAALQNAMGTINQLMDTCSVSSVTKPRFTADPDRAALNALMEREPRPAVVMNRQGEVVAANNRALDLLSRNEGLPLRSELADAVRGGRSDRVESAERLGTSDFWWLLVAT